MLYMATLVRLSAIILTSFFQNVDILTYPNQMDPYLKKNESSYSR